MKRLFKDGIILTVIGLFAIVGAIYMYMSKDYTSLEAGQLSAMGLIFLRAKDSLIPLIGKKSV